MYRAPPQRGCHRRSGGWRERCGHRVVQQTAAHAMRHARMAQATICEEKRNGPKRRPFLIGRLHRSLQEDDEGRARTTAHAHPVLRHVEAARQPARQLQTTQQNPCLAFGKGFFQLFSGAAGRQQTSRKKLLFTASPTPEDHREGALAVPWCPRRAPGTPGGAYSGGRK